VYWEGGGGGAEARLGECDAWAWGGLGGSIITRRALGEGKWRGELGAVAERLPGWGWG